MDLKPYIRDVPDFPVAGILFRDITPLLRDQAAFRNAIEALQAHVAQLRVDAVVAIESRGFLLGAPIALGLGLPFVPIRKPGKLPAERMSIEYALEYGSGQLDIHADALRPGDRVVVVDDLIATGGTARAAADLVGMLGAEVAGFVFLVELASLNGREKLAGQGVFSLIQFD